MAKNKLAPQPAKSNALTPEYVRAALSYSKSTGVFRWKFRANVHHGINTKYCGRVAGTVSAVSGYRLIGIGGVRVYAHRLAIFYVTGKWPDCFGDHRNGVRDDNRWRNIRQATFAQNSHNTKKPRTNTSGYKGVSWCRVTRAWVAIIICHGQRTRLGYFSSRKDAGKAYRKAAKQMFGSYVRHA